MPRSSPTQPAEPPSETRARGLAKMGEVYGFDFTDGPDELFAITADHLFAGIWSRPGLSLRDRRLLLLGALSASGLFDVAGIQVNAALHNGELSPEQLCEAARVLGEHLGSEPGEGLDAVVSAALDKA